MRMRESIEARKPRYRGSCPSISCEPTRRRRLYNFFPTIAIIRRRTLLLTAFTSCDTAKKRRSVRREAEASGISGYRPSGLHRGERSISFGLLLGGSILLTEIVIAGYHSGLLSLFGHASGLRGLRQDLPVPRLHGIATVWWTLFATLRRLLPSGSLRSPWGSYSRARSAASFGCRTLPSTRRQRS
jgi:hypothetical protein